MKSNQEIVTAFYNKKIAKNCNMESTGTRLYSYNICIAEHIEDKIVLNKTKYSQTTTTKQQRLF